MLVPLSVLKPTELLHLQVAGWDLPVDEAVWVFLLWTVQLLSILIHMLQHPTAVGRRQLESHLWFEMERCTDRLPTVGLKNLQFLCLHVMQLSRKRVLFDQREAHTH